MKLCAIRTLVAIWITLPKKIVSSLIRSILLVWNWLAIAYELLHPEFQLGQEKYFGTYSASVSSPSSELGTPVIHVYDGQGQNKEVALLDKLHSSPITFIEVTYMHVHVHVHANIIMDQYACPLRYSCSLVCSLLYTVCDSLLPVQYTPDQFSGCTYSPIVQKQTR